MLYFFDKTLLDVFLARVWLTLNQSVLNNKNLKQEI